MPLSIFPCPWPLTLSLALLGAGGGTWAGVPFPGPCPPPRSAATQRNGAGDVCAAARARGMSCNPWPWREAQGLRGVGGLHKAARARVRRPRLRPGGPHKADGRPQAGPEGAHRIARNPFERQEQPGNSLARRDGATVAASGGQRPPERPPNLLPLWSSCFLLDYRDFISPKRHAKRVVSKIVLRSVAL